MKIALTGMPMRRLGKTEEMVSLLCVGGLHMGTYETPDGLETLPIDQE
ncbi:unnamed protein product, partial [marine sediment metagenome]